jgi:hypothetical protein
MRFVLLAALTLAAAEEKLTPLDRANLEVARLRIDKAETDYRYALLLRAKVVAGICERVDATEANCRINDQAGTVSKAAPEKTEAPKEKTK